MKQFRLLLLAIWCIASLCARATATPAPPTLAAASALARLDESGRPAGWHAWVMVVGPSRATADSKQPAKSDALLIHLPPATAYAPRVPGAARSIAPLGFPFVTTHLAARQNRVYLAVPAPPQPTHELIPPPPTPPTRVLSFATGYAEGRWLNYGPPDELRSLPPDRDVLGFGATSEGLVALLAPGGKGAALVQVPQLQVLRWGLNQSWQDIDMPSDIGRSWDRVTLVCGGSACAVYLRPADAERAELWIAQFEQEVVAGPPAPIRLGGKPPSQLDVSWQRVALPADPGSGAFLHAPMLTWTSRGLAFALRERQTVGQQPDDEANGWQVRLLEPGQDVGGVMGASLWARATWRSVGRVLIPAGPGVMVSMDGEDRLMFLWPSGRRGDAAQADVLGALGQLEYAMLSTATGRMWESGTLALQSPVAPKDFRLIVLLVSWVVGLVLLVLIRPADVHLVLPDDLALAEPLRRLIAGLIDLTLAVVVGGLLAGLSFEEMLTLGPGDLLLTNQGQVMLLTAAGVGVLAGTIGESFFGRSVGKSLTGCFVVRAVRADATSRRSKPRSGEVTDTGEIAWDDLTYPSVAESFLRNFIKWCLPPAGLVAVWREAARHRGEQYTRTAVVIAAPEESDQFE